MGRSNRWVRQLEEQGRVQLDGLTPGQGLFAIVSSPFGGADAVVVAGADPAGTLYAANDSRCRSRRLESIGQRPCSLYAFNLPGRQ
ncbi:MAG: hypothetical protein OXQ89_11465 [Rhodospirillaceae bacterium]|nr:hypothetical protein [Rhodospirillaceae bacterium]